MDEPTPGAKPPPRSPHRPRRFRLPHEHHDARTSERIEAFLEGPPRPPDPGRSERLRRGANRPIELDTMEEWRAALRRETVRAERYARPATVLVVDVGSEPDSVPAVDLVGPVLDAIRYEARDTDRAVRTSPTRFHLLLPETGEADAQRFAQRLGNACRNRLNGHGAAVRLRLEVATPPHGASLDGALDDAERRLAY